MAKRYVGSLLIGILIGGTVAVVIGWGLWPAENTNSPLQDLDSAYQEEYTIMIAEGYLYDRDVNGALARLQPLNKADIFAFIQQLTERFISQSNIPAITPMVALAEAIGRLTPAMEIYRSTPVSTLAFGN
ncbi:MAG: hypothetical protein JXA10_14775 [Anaerolineae bacterium]|nr:hypothetical protein [Anaerolineae bacterium]